MTRKARGESKPRPPRPAENHAARGREVNTDTFTRDELLAFRESVAVVHRVVPENLA